MRVCVCEKGSHNEKHPGLQEACLLEKGLLGHVTCMGQALSQNLQKRERGERRGENASP